MDDGCQLECVKTVKPRVHEFVGPVKIAIVHQPSAEYWKKKLGADIVILACFLLGWTTLSILYFSIGFFLRHAINAHIFLATIGFQMLIPVGILNFNILSGPAMVIAIANREREHVITQLFGLAYAVIGAVVVTFRTKYDEYDSHYEKFSLHSMTGYLATLFTFIAAVIGVFIYCLREYIPCQSLIKMIHRFCGVICFVMSSICFISGVWKPCMNMWFEHVSVTFYFLIGFCVFYTIVIIVSPLLNMVKDVRAMF